MIKIDKIESRLVSDSRHEDTIEVALYSGIHQVKASVPSGKSKGIFEAVSVGAEQAQKTIVDLNKKITAKKYDSLEKFDNFLQDLDGTKNKSNLGVNVTLALSIAFVRLLSAIEDVPVYQALREISGTRHSNFPKLFVNLIEGGIHVKEELHAVPFQEYLVIPQEDSPQKALKMVEEFIVVLEQEIRDYQHRLPIGDEGGIVISGDDPEIDLKILQKALSKTNFNDRMIFGLDVAASSLWNKDDQKYDWRKQAWTSGELLVKYHQLIERYPLLSIEDPFDQEAWDDWNMANAVLGGKVWIVGDDLTVTNTERIKKAKEKNAANAVIIKPNQIGTITETIEAVNLAKSFGWKIIVSHRSGETEDDFIADLAYGIAADGLKAGSPLQKQRLVKYERLIEIENSL